MGRNLVLMHITTYLVFTVFLMFEADNGVMEAVTIKKS